MNVDYYACWMLWRSRWDLCINARGKRKLDFLVLDCLCWIWREKKIEILVCTECMMRLIQQINSQIYFFCPCSRDSNQINPNWTVEIRFASVRFDCTRRFRCWFLLFSGFFLTIFQAFRKSYEFVYRIIERADFLGKFSEKSGKITKILGFSGKHGKSGKFSENRDNFRKFQKKKENMENSQKKPENSRKKPANSRKK